MISFPYSSQTDNLTVPGIDSETAEWPIPAGNKSEFNLTRLTHRVVPLPIYDEDKQFVDCTKANNALVGSTVEVHFLLKHYAFKTESYDTFCGIPRQVVILHHPQPKHDPYKRNIQDGPVSLSETPSHPSPSEKKRTVDCG
jgi:hypothetical protein